MTSPSTTANRLSLCIAENPTYIPKVSFMGGELFENREIAKHVYDTIVESSKLIAQDIRFSISSNLIHLNLDILIKCLSRLSQQRKVDIHTSFDFGSLRFHSQTYYQLFRRNLLELATYCKTKNINIGIETIRTRQMLEAFQSNSDQKSVFKRLTETFDICQNEYIGDDPRIRLTVPESIELWKNVIEECPKCSDLISQFLDHGRNCLNVKRLTLCGTKLYDGCYYQKYGEQIDQKSTDIIRMLTTYNCLSCEFGTFCSYHCPIDNLYKTCDKFSVLKWAHDNHVPINGKYI